MQLGAAASLQQGSARLTNVNQGAGVLLAQTFNPPEGALVPHEDGYLLRRYLDPLGPVFQTNQVRVSLSCLFLVYPSANQVGGLPNQAENGGCATVEGWDQERLRPTKLLSPQQSRFQHGPNLLHHGPHLLLSCAQSPKI